MHGVCHQLTTEERLYLHAARVGDYGLLREIHDCAAHQWQSTSSDQAGLQPAAINVNCTDYMGRNALHLAVDSENIDCIELLLDRLSSQCHEEVNSDIDHSVAQFHAVTGCRRLMSIHTTHVHGTRVV